jgi:protease II
MATTVAKPSGSEIYELSVMKEGVPLWKHKHLGGPDVAILKERVFFLESDSPLRNSRLVSLDLFTGQKRCIEFEEKDPRWSLSLHRGSNECLFLIREQAGTKQCYHVKASGHIRRLERDAATVYPIGATAVGGYPILLIRKESLAAPWTFSGAPSGWGLEAAQAAAGIEFATSEILVTKEFGIRTLWRIGNYPKRLFEFLGNPIADPIADWRSEPLRTLWIESPGKTLECLTIGEKTVRLSKPGKTYAFIKHGETNSKDGLPVRWVMVRGKDARTKGLLVYAYGAYGLTTPLGTARWKPWLDAGWVIAFALVRGGGDGNDAWTDLGRLGGKRQGVDDFEAVCQHMQKITRVGPERTCVFGRSAGGLMIGGIAARPGIAGIIYGEAPYLDLLKSAGMEDYPLTPGEYLEFGNPRASPADFEQCLQVSPIHLLGPAGAPGVFVVCRAGTADLQVFPYEPLKWIIALRGGRHAPDGKYLGVGSEGHFSKGDKRFTEYAEDFILINAFVNRT